MRLRPFLMRLALLVLMPFAPLVQASAAAPDSNAQPSDMAHFPPPAPLTSNGRALPPPEMQSMPGMQMPANPENPPAAPAPNASGGK